MCGIRLDIERLSRAVARKSCLDTPGLRAVVYYDIRKTTIPYQPHHGRPGLLQS